MSLEPKQLETRLQLLAVGNSLGLALAGNFAVDEHLHVIPTSSVASTGKV